MHVFVYFLSLVSETFHGHSTSLHKENGPQTEQPLGQNLKGIILGTLIYLFFCFQAFGVFTRLPGCSPIAINFELADTAFRIYLAASDCMTRIRRKRVDSELAAAFLTRRFSTGSVPLSLSIEILRFEDQEPFPSESKLSLQWHMYI